MENGNINGNDALDNEKSDRDGCAAEDELIDDGSTMEDKRRMTTAHSTELNQEKNGFAVEDEILGDDVVSG